MNYKTTNLAAAAEGNKGIHKAQGTSSANNYRRKSLGFASFFRLKTELN